MNKATMIGASEPSDAELVAQALAGSRDAFGRIVARYQSLELSQDAVKQRLARGRKLLHQEVLAFVEGALEHSVPGSAFTLGVLAALPMAATSAKAATLGAAAVKGSTVAKAASALSWAGAILGPVLGLLGAWLGTKAGIENTRSPRERQFMVRASKLTWAYVLGFDVLVGAMIFLSAKAPHATGGFWTLGFIVITVLFVVGLVALIIWTNRNQRRIRREETARAPATAISGPRAPSDYYEYRSRLSFLGLPLLHVCSGRRPDGRAAVARGWVAVGGLAYGVLFAVGGIAIGGISFGGLALGVVAIGGAGLGVLSLAGVAAGIWAAGGAVAVGMFAFSGACAIAWTAAAGTTAIAHEFARGSGLTLAHHANDAAAKAFIEAHHFFALSRPRVFLAIIGLCWLPMLLVIWQSLGISRNRANSVR